MSLKDLIWPSCGLAAVAIFLVAAMLAGRTRWSSWYSIAWPCVAGSVLAACWWYVWSVTWIGGAWSMDRVVYSFIPLVPVVTLAPLLVVAHPKRWLLPSLALIPVASCLAVATVYYTQTYPVAVQVQTPSGAPLSSRHVEGRLGPNLGQECEVRGPIVSAFTDAEGKVSFRVRKDQMLHFDVVLKGSPYSGFDLWLASPQNQSLVVAWARDGNRTIDVLLSNFGAGYPDASIFQHYRARVKRPWGALVVPYVEQPRDSPYFDMARVWRRTWPGAEVQETSIHKLITLTIDDLRVPQTPEYPNGPTQNTRLALLLSKVRRSISHLERQSDARADAERASSLLCRQLLGDVKILQHQERLAALNTFIQQRAEIFNLVAREQLPSRELQIYRQIHALGDLSTIPTSELLALYGAATGEPKKVLKETIYGRRMEPDELLATMAEGSDNFVRRFIGSFHYENSTAERTKQAKTAFYAWLLLNPKVMSEEQVATIKQALLFKRVQQIEYITPEAVLFLIDEYAFPAGFEPFSYSLYHEWYARNQAAVSYPFHEEVKRRLESRDMTVQPPPKRLYLGF